MPVEMTIRAHIMNLVPVGYYREMGGSAEQQASRPGLADHVRPAPQPDEDRIVAYLDGAPMIAVRGGPLHSDVLNPAAGVRIQCAQYSDGVFVWSSLLSYYIRTYHILVPEDFVDHIARRGWTPPDRVEIIPD